MKFRVTFTGMQENTPVNLTLAFSIDHSLLTGLEGESHAHVAAQLAALDKMDEKAKVAAAREMAWDAYKRKTGLRRWTGDEAPVVELADGSDSGTNHNP